jgi:hypothetical protein
MYACRARRLIAATNSYFDGITSHDGRIIQAIAGCQRFENGQTMAGRGNTPPPPRLARCRQ